MNPEGSVEKLLCASFAISVSLRWVVIGLNFTAEAQRTLR